MRKGASILIISISLIACNSKQRPAEKESEPEKKSSNSDTSSQAITSTQLDNPKKLIGIWIKEGEENPSIEMTKSNVNYIEHLTSYKYEILKDTIGIKELAEDGDNTITYKLVYKLKGKDTLILKSDDDDYKTQSLYVRVKN